MGKAGKRIRAAGRKAKRLEAKRAKRALYASYKGKSNKGKRIRAYLKGNKKPKSRVHDKCGNIGCLFCNPVVQNLPRSLYVQVKLGNLTFDQALKQRRVARGWDKS